MADYLSDDVVEIMKARLEAAFLEKYADHPMVQAAAKRDTGTYGAGNVGLINVLEAHSGLTTQEMIDALAANDGLQEAVIATFNRHRPAGSREADAFLDQNTLSSRLSARQAESVEAQRQAAATEQGESETIPSIKDVTELLEHKGMEIRSAGFSKIALPEGPFTDRLVEAGIAYEKNGKILIWSGDLQPDTLDRINAIHERLPEQGAALDGADQAMHKAYAEAQQGDDLPAFEVAEADNGLKVSNAPGNGAGGRALT